MTMNTKTILSAVALIFGEAIIIAAFFLWKGEAPDNIFVLNLIVSSLIYCLFFVDVLVPWIDKAGKRVGTLGLRWAVTWLYAALAIVAMLLFNLVFNAAFGLQLIIHCCLVFFAALGFIGVMHASGKVAEVHDGEVSDRKGMLEMKESVASLKESAAGHPGLSPECISMIDNIEQELRFISPCGTSEAVSLERQFSETIRDTAIALLEDPIDPEKILSALRRAERTLKKRKATYSD